MSFKIQTKKKITNIWIKMIECCIVVFLAWLLLFGHGYCEKPFLIPLTGPSGSQLKYHDTKVDKKTREGPAMLGPLGKSGASKGIFRFVGL